MADILDKVRYSYTDSGSTVTISAKAGESHKVTEIYIDSPAADSYVDVKIGTKVVARLPVKLGDSLFFAPFSDSLEKGSIMTLVHKIFGSDVFFEGDEDEDITLEFSASQTGIHVFYEVGKTGVDKSKLGRSACENYLLFAIVTHSAAIGATGNYELDTALVPEGFPDVANDFVIPSGRAYVIKALAAGVAASGNSIPTKLHFYDETFEFFDPLAHAGVTIDPSHNILKTDITNDMVYKVEDYMIESGHKVTLTIDATYDGTNAIAADTEKAVLIGLWRTK